MASNLTNTHGSAQLPKLAPLGRFAQKVSQSPKVRSKLLTTVEVREGVQPNSPLGASTAGEVECGGSEPLG